jgi:N-acetylmuramoyl-L-alanine amidase
MPALAHTPVQPSAGIRTTAVSAPLDVLAGKSASSGEIDLMARVVYAEAKGEPFAGKTAVAAVILNRVEHPDFPGSVREVIYQPRAFCVVASTAIRAEPSPVAVRAVKAALAGTDPTGGALFFFNPQTATCRWIRARERVVVIGRHVFAK